MVDETIAIHLKSPFIWKNNLHQGPEVTTHNVIGALGTVIEVNQGGIIMIVAGFIDENNKPISKYVDINNCGKWFFPFILIDPINLKQVILEGGN